MSDEKKYLFFCWGAIILTGVLIATNIVGTSRGISVILGVLIVILCGSACYIGNRPGEVQIPKK